MPRTRCSRFTVDWSIWTVVLLKPDCVARGLVDVVATAVADVVTVVDQRLTIATDGADTGPLPGPAHDPAAVLHLGRCRGRPAPYLCRATSRHHARPRTRRSHTATLPARPLRPQPGRTLLDPRPVRRRLAGTGPIRASPHLPTSSTPPTIRPAPSASSTSGTGRRTATFSEHPTSTSPGRQP
jgi:hypothetical protein